ncbi:MAG: Holliday junction branch migration protein RuvA [Gammaproteobacteria bacterium]|nr:Holliday junction branch migration protein RuvA [Gammaproteobacteria bacterium]MBQ0840719.1 Holliday junction branch migration protein RuvA [Gammaproteobacteria bacterium]
MIGRIRGILLEKQAPHLLLDVQGVGYEIQASLTTFFELPALEQAVTLHTHFVVREDAQLLYGFSSLAERQLFRELIKVNGVGPKMALAILSGMNSAEFVHCVKSKDIATLVRLPGVGKKTAERLVVEMHDRVEKWALGDGAAGLVASQPSSSAVQEAESALISLGYKEPEAAKMIAAVTAGNEQATSAQLIRAALKNKAA